MRNILALVAAFTLSSSTAVTAVACGGQSGTTTRIFNWNEMINNTAGWSSSDLFNFLLSNTNNGIGQSLYKDVIDYVNLSILKTDTTFQSDYEFAKTTVTNQLQNEQDSLRAKYGRSWESKWKDVLKQTSNGGDGKTGSYSRYFDSKLKTLATGIVTQHYVTDNFNNYEYYESSRIQLWLQDLFSAVKPGASTAQDVENNINNYVNKDGAYKAYVWIIAKANTGIFNPSDPDKYKALATAIFNATSFTGVQITNPVPKTLNDDPNNNNYIVDTNSANAIKGLLSSQQANIARLWMKNQGPLWTRQIVVGFDSDVKDPLTSEITLDSDFKKSKSIIDSILKNISTQGFNAALSAQTQGNVKPVTSSAATGDLGLSVNLSAKNTDIKPAFEYYVNRYVTSNQGIGLSNPGYDIAQFSYDTSSGANNPEKLISNIDHQYNNGRTADNSAAAPGGILNQTSQYRDEVYINDFQSDAANPENPIASGAGQNKVAIFIDEDGLHFVQTPGITYKPTLTNDSTQNIITNFNNLLVKNPTSIKWSDAAKVVNRPGGLTGNPYLDYLQTENLRAISSDNGTKSGIFFNLSDSLKTFTGAASQDLNSPNWWDYVLYFNNNIKNINWNIGSNGLSTLLGDHISASNDVVNNFTQTLANWFKDTYQQRWNSLQGITSTDTLKSNINGWNTNLDSKISSQTPDVTPARLNADDLITYLRNVADNSIWWYDPNGIKN